MSSRVLTPDVVGIDALVHDHQTVLAKAEGGVVAVFANNAPAFYAITPARLAELLALEEKLARPGSDVAPGRSTLSGTANRSRCRTHGEICHVSGLATRCRLYPPRRRYGAWH